MDASILIIIFIVLYLGVLAGSFYYFRKNDMLRREFGMIVLGISAVGISLGIFGMIRQEIIWLFPCAMFGGITGALLLGQSARVSFLNASPELKSERMKLSNKEIDALRTSEVIVRKVSYGLSNDKFSEGDMEQLNRAVILDAANAEAFHLLAYLSVEQEKLDDALRYVNKALEIDHENVDYLDLLDYINER